jgi:HK97 family phage major capsid protein
MAELKEVVEKINQKFAELREANDKGLKEIEVRSGEMTAETKEQVEKINTDITELRNQQDTIEKAIQMARLPNGEVRAEKTPEMEKREKAFIVFARTGSDHELRTLDGSTDADGGILIPPSFEAGIIMNAFNEADVRPVCQAGPTGRDLVIFGSMAKPTVAWGSGTISKQNSSAGGEKMSINDLRALITISSNTLEDAEANIIQELTLAFSMAVAEAEDDAFMVGTGVEQPSGIMKTAGVLTRFKKTNVAAALYDATYNGVDVLISALYSLKKMYRRRAHFAMNSATEAGIRTLKDSNKNYLWQPPVQAGAPATLLGRPLLNPEGMDDIGANKYPIVVGDFSQYKIRDRRGLTVQRLNERYADDDEIGFIVKKRVGGRAVKAEAFTPIKVAA